MAKRGQMEIMGLVVIVILITIGFVFYLSFSGFKPKPNIIKTFEQDQLAANFIIAFLKTNSECERYTMENMIQDCAVEKKIECEGKNSCIYVNDTAKVIISSTLDTWGKKYAFEIENMGFPVNYTSECGARTNGDLALQPISLYPYPGTVIVKVKLCP